ncbi:MULTISPECIES: hypothetical protein [unclassified Rhodococcus (in: high G+C Gram-positive bacteria)]|uniref:hypothetical protein n=1 Tax=Rhodococcus sp. SJ-3 TaxID=3454628 RepID=UPI003F794D99
MSISIANTGVGVVTVAAPLISGFMLDRTDVSAVFWFSFAPCAVGGLLTLFFVPEAPLRAKVSVDWIGAFLLTVALFTIMLALSLGAGWGWLSAKTLGTLTVTVILALAWVMWERRCAEPLISIDILASRKVGITLLAGGNDYSATTLIATLIPIPLQTPKDTADYGFGLSATDMALWMSRRPADPIGWSVRRLHRQADRIPPTPHRRVHPDCPRRRSAGHHPRPGVADRVRLRPHRIRLDDLRRHPQPGDDGTAA